MQAKQETVFNGGLTSVVQVTEKTETFMEDSRRLANTAARLEQNKEEVARQVNAAVASSISVMHLLYIPVTIYISRWRGLSLCYLLYHQCQQARPQWTRVNRHCKI